MLDQHEREVESGELEIWFFCGILLLAYGLVLVATGIWEYHNPPQNEVLLPFLQPLHPTLWWGAAMTVLGAFYTVRFRPNR